MLTFLQLQLDYLSVALNIPQTMLYVIPWYVVPQMVPPQSRHPPHYLFFKIFGPKAKILLFYLFVFNYKNRVLYNVYGVQNSFYVLIWAYNLT